MNRTVPPCSASCRARFMTSCASTGPSEEVGSSRISSLGSRPQALAISIICRAGTGRVRTSRWTPIEPVGQADLRQHGLRLRPAGPAGRPESAAMSCAGAGRAAGSRSPKAGRPAGIPGRPGPRRAGQRPRLIRAPAAARRSRSRRRPAGPIRPASPISVDLPAPFSPTTPITWPAFRSSSGRSRTLTGP